MPRYGSLDDGAYIDPPDDRGDEAVDVSDYDPGDDLEDGCEADARADRYFRVR